MHGLLAWVGRGNDGAHGFLIEPFEPTVALKVFQVATNRALLHELLALFPRDKSGGNESFGALAPHRPAFAFGKCLPQAFKI